MDSQTLTRLLKGEHLSMPERLALGLWPHPPISYDEVFDHLVKLLQESQWFPRPYHPHRPGEPVDEYPTIERVSEDQFVYRAKRGQPWNSSEIAASLERPTTAHEAAELYLRWGLNLPGDLDGWKVVRG